MKRKHILIEPGSGVYGRNQSLLANNLPSSSGGGRLAELAGGTAADCAAIACCCPATVVNLLVLAVYKIPAGICRKALREHRRRRLMRKGLLPFRSSTSWDEATFAAAAVEDDEELTIVVVEGSQIDKDLMELEKEMWQSFESGGFWRSPSQKQC